MPSSFYIETGRNFHIVPLIGAKPVPKFQPLSQREDIFDFNGILEMSPVPLEAYPKARQHFLLEKTIVMVRAKMVSFLISPS